MSLLFRFRFFRPSAATHCLSFSFVMTYLYGRWEQSLWDAALDADHQDVERLVRDTPYADFKKKYMETEYYNDQLAQQLALRGMLGTLRLLHSFGVCTPPSCYPVQAACQVDQLECLRFFIEEVHCPIGRAMHAAACHGAIQCLTYLHTSTRAIENFDSELMCEQVQQSGSETCISYWKEHQTCHSNPCSLSGN